MKIIVQKFGGTSVSTEENRNHCLKHIKNSLSKGYKVIVVVSAMGRKGEPYATDSLLSLIDKNIGEKELDLLMFTGELISAVVFSNMLNNNEISNTILTGGQAGIITNNNHTNARIIDLQPKRLSSEFLSNDVIIVPGFQGMTADGEFTTLGRGGSDTSATALGVALNAEMVEIFTDVDGIMTADPRIVADAKILESSSYNEICNLAQLGATVIHPRAVEIAMQKNIPIRVRSTFSSKVGTLVTAQNELNGNDSNIKDRLITGITQTSNIVQFSIINNDEQQVILFDILNELKISIDFINLFPNTSVFTINENDKTRLMERLDDLSFKYTVRENCSKVSMVGGGISGVPGIMSKIVTSLKRNNIDVLQSSDSHTTIWVLVETENMKNSVRILHDVFELNKVF